MQLPPPMGGDSGMLLLGLSVTCLELQEPWVNDAVVIGGASAVLSPIIQWGHTILQSKPQVLTNQACQNILHAVHHHQSHHTHYCHYAS